ncbi:DNA replication/repair protein RecF [Aliikangiella sp. IMCC44359]|uniref:DNA replication/repair protein RecF n=1 Tax=Aliikangiella sp. IMCC44359 TaxID=3459125 RepID=UPI00403AC0D6
MFLKAFQYQGFRNLKSGKIELDKDLNIFYGSNGAGKSSILEAIGFLTSGRSFRTTKLDLTVANESQEFSLFASSNDNTRIGLGYQKDKKQKQIRLNGEKLSALSHLSRLCPTQILSPESYHLIDSGPAERRKYLDWSLFHVKHSYHEIWKSYGNTLKQRNALLKRYNNSSLNEQLPFWNQQLCRLAEQVNNERLSLLSKLEIKLNNILSILKVDFCENLKISYYSGYTGDLAEKLIDSLENDKESGYTRFGPHKADLRIKVNGFLAKDYLSRGQKKVIINALYLAQTSLLKELSSKDSLFIIDDFTSELDLDNQQALLDMLFKQKNVQIILSCLQLDSLHWLKKRYNNAHMFHVEHGEITPIKLNETN